MAAQPPEARPTISTHVLDTERGAPAVGVHVSLYRLDVGDGPIRMTQALTDGDGRVRDACHQARERGVRFLRHDEDSRPSVGIVDEGGEKRVRVTAEDLVLGETVTIDADIVGLNIPNGIPLVYELDAQLRPIRHYYLGDAEAAARAAAAVANQGKA